MVADMPRWLPLRRSATSLKVRLATAFRWRHRWLHSVTPQPQPTLTGSVVAGESYVPYSEKGSRSTSGPGSWGCRVRPQAKDIPTRRRFRRFIDGKPSCVFLACTDQQTSIVLVGRGRPSLLELQAALTRVLDRGAQLEADGFAPYAAVCQSLSVRWQMRNNHQVLDYSRLHGRFVSWLRQFRGVATRYLPRYLAWFSLFLGFNRTKRPRPLQPSTPPAA